MTSVGEDVEVAFDVTFKVGARPSKTYEPSLDRNQFLLRDESLRPDPDRLDPRVGLYFFFEISEF